MSYYVSRQKQWPDGQLYVEIASNRLEYSSPGMLVGKIGEEGVYNDPREAVKAAWDLLEKWIKRNPDEDIRLAYGYNLDMVVIPEEDMAEDKEEVERWANEEYLSLTKCGECGDIVSEGYTIFDWEDVLYCSERCADKAHWDFQELLVEEAV